MWGHLRMSNPRIWLSKKHACLARTVSPGRQPPDRDTTGNVQETVRFKQVNGNKMMPSCLLYAKSPREPRSETKILSLFHQM